MHLDEEHDLQPALRALHGHEGFAPLCRWVEGEAARRVSPGSSARTMSGILQGSSDVLLLPQEQLHAQPAQHAAHGRPPLAPTQPPQPPKQRGRELKGGGAVAPSAAAAGSSSLDGRCRGGAPQPAKPKPSKRAKRGRRSGCPRACAVKRPR